MKKEMKKKKTKVEDNQTQGADTHRTKVPQGAKPKPQKIQIRGEHTVNLSAYTAF